MTTALDLLKTHADAARDKHLAAYNDRLATDTAAANQTAGAWFDTLVPTLRALFTCIPVYSTKPAESWEAGDNPVRTIVGIALTLIEKPDDCTLTLYLRSNPPTFSSPRYADPHYDTPLNIYHFKQALSANGYDPAGALHATQTEEQQATILHNALNAQLAVALKERDRALLDVARKAESEAYWAKIQDEEAAERRDRDLRRAIHDPIAQEAQAALAEIHAQDVATARAALVAEAATVAQERGWPADTQLTLYEIAWCAGDSESTWELYWSPTPPTIDGRFQQATPNGLVPTQIVSPNGYRVTEHTYRTGQSLPVYWMYQRFESFRHVRTEVQQDCTCGCAGVTVSDTTDVEIPHDERPMVLQEDLRNYLIPWTD